MRYYVDFVDKDHGDYIVKCNCENHDGQYWQTILITKDIYKWFADAKENDKANYKQKQNGKIITIYLAKLSINNKIVLRAEFEDNVVDINELYFKNQAKCYRYQVLIDIKVFNTLGELTSYNYRFLKSAIAPKLKHVIIAIKSVMAFKKCIKNIFLQKIYL